MKEQYVTLMDDSARLLTLSGCISTQKVEFLLDSGASNNFVSSHLLKQLGLVSYGGPRVRVRLADRSYVVTNQYIRIIVDFGQVQAFLHFTVLDVECPNILGMPFLKCVNPMIDWQQQKVVFRQQRGVDCVSGGGSV